MTVETLFSPMMPDLDRLHAKLVQVASSLLACHPPSPSSAHIPVLPVFAAHLMKKEYVSPASFITCIVLLQRAARNLPAGAKGLYCTPHRLLMAAVLIAMKSLYDTPPTNKQWAAAFPALFTLADVNLMEKQMLALLDWHIFVTPEEWYKLAHGLVRASPSHTAMGACASLGPSPRSPMPLASLQHRAVGMMGRRKSRKESALVLQTHLMARSSEHTMLPSPVSMCSDAASETASIDQLSAGSTMMLSNDCTSMTSRYTKCDRFEPFHLDMAPSYTQAAISPSGQDITATLQQHLHTMPLTPPL